MRFQAKEKQMKEGELRFIRKRTPFLWRFMNKIGFEPEAGGLGGETALMRAVEGGYRPAYEHVAVMLMRNGWSLNTRDFGEHAPIHLLLDLWNWKASCHFLQYDMDQDVLVDALYWALRGSGEIDPICGKVILTLIEKIGGISPENCPHALLYALGGRGIPYIAPLVAAGFTYEDELYYQRFYPDFDGQERVFSQFMAQREHFTFESRDDSPLYLADGMIRARPELYHRVWPRLSRRIKKEIKRQVTRLSTLNRISSWSSRGFR